MQRISTSVESRELQAANYPALIARAGVIVDINEAAIEDLGTDLKGAELLPLLAREEREELAPYLLGHRLVGPPIRTTFCTAGGRRLVESSWVPIVFGGEPATLVTWRDVSATERVQAWLSAITDSSMDLIAITDLKGNLLYMNEALMRLRGDTSRAGLPDGRNAIEHAAPGQSEIVDSLLAELETSGRWRGELMFRGVDGVVPVDAVIERSEVAGETVYSLIGRDISQELALRTELRGAIEQRDSFVAHVAHEIKNPLSAIVGMALVLRNETDPTPAQQEMLDLLISGASDIERVVEDLTHMSTGAGAPIWIAAEVLDLEPIARTVIETIEAASGVRIQLEGAASCVGDAVRIRQVLRNLLTNAVRYGGPEISVQLRSREDRAQIEVSDNGDGVPDEFSEIIFDNFSSAHNTVEGSMGVGLAVSRQLTIGMGGSLSYEWKEGRTRFTVDLPAHS
jgi:two-component system CheB/CheR fusion protein